MCNGNDLLRIRRRKISNNKAMRDNLKGGLGKFLNVKIQNEKKEKDINKIYNADYYKIKNKYKNEYNKYIFTQRVLLPQKNMEEIEKTKKIRTFASQEKYLRHATDGSYRSIMLKTPEYFPTKGRKKINKSNDCGNKPDSDIFFRNKNEDYKVDDRLFGVERKCRSRYMNTESSLPRYKFGRKPFFEKRQYNPLY